MTTIQLTDVVKDIKGKRIIDHVSLEMESGKVVGLKGVNGSGKTMLMRLICGLIVPTSGSITINGKRLGKDITFPESVGILIENPAFLDAYSGFENLKLLASIKNRIGAEKIREVIALVGLDPNDKKKYRKYSLGMKQRLGIAAALLGYPKVLILDEPTNGLDPAGIQEMRELICDLPRRFGMTVVVSSHLLSEIDQMADHVGIIREGELVFQDTLETLHSRSTHHLALRTTNDPVAQALLRDRGLPCQEEDGYLILPILPDGETARLTGFLAENRLGILRLEERQKSLEDIFLELTGKAASL